MQKTEDDVTTTVQFEYNEDGLRTKKAVTVGNDTVVTEYVLHGKNIVHMTQDSDNLHFLYDAQGKPAEVIFNGIAYGYLYNLQGDVVALVNGSGMKVVEYTFDAWGKPTSKTGSLASTLGAVQPFRYRGYVFDEETGLYYLRSRYYQSGCSRFVSADSIYDENLFAYCKDSPIAQCDSDGTFGLLCALLIGAVVGAVISGGTSAVTQYVSTGEVNWGIVAVDAGVGAITGAVAATGIGASASVAIGAAAGGIQYIGEQLVEGEEIDPLDLTISVVAGGIGGAIGGSGANLADKSQSLNTISHTMLRETRRANQRYALKHITRLSAERSAIRLSVGISATRLALGTISSSVFDDQVDSLLHRRPVE